MIDVDEVREQGACEVAIKMMGVTKDEVKKR